jgi:DDE superfamily endonuclease
LPNGRALTGQSHDYKRRGTTTLFAALEVSTGKIIATHSKRRRRVEFLDFMNSVTAAFQNRKLHVILDNLNTHKKNEHWFTSQCAVSFHADKRVLVQSGRGIVLNLARARDRHRLVEKLPGCSAVFAGRKAGGSKPGPRNGDDRMAEILGSLARQTLRYTQLGLAAPARRKESARNWRTMHKALKKPLPTRSRS